jgi:hypothetical protein
MHKITTSRHKAQRNKLGQLQLRGKHNGKCKGAFGKKGGAK